MLCLFLFGLPLDAQTVKVNWRRGAPFATYKTYAWQDSTNPGRKRAQFRKRENRLSSAFRSFFKSYPPKTK